MTFVPVNWQGRFFVEGRSCLMEIYALVDNVKSLPHSLTPYVTLAYYHINGLPAEKVGKLKKTVAELNETPHDFILDNERLYYQTFTA